ncbi:MAG: VPS10 domain-containing protein [Bacteroidales bacterium]
MSRRFVRGGIVVLLCLLVIAGVARVLVAQGGASAPTDPQARLKWFEAHKTMAGQTPFKDLKWQFIGPTNVSGRVIDVAVATPRGKFYTIYAATATGGLWKTDNDGTSWEAVWDGGPTASIGDVTIAPSNQDIVWMGTGEANIFRSSNAGIGVYKSTDAGKTWQHMGLAGTYTIPRIVIHPKDPNIVYVAASGHEWTDNEERGVFKTIDGGKTWQKILYVNARTGAIDLVMDPLDPNTLYAATWQRIRSKWNDPRTLPDYNASGIHKTTDGGKTWTPINQGLPEPRFRGRIGLDVARSKPNVVYAFLDNYEIARQAKPGETDAYGRPAGGTIKGAEIYRSDDKGKTWRKVSAADEPMAARQPGAGAQRGAPPAALVRTRMESAAGTYGWVFGQVRVDPNDENTVYFMGLGLNRSTDGGKTFYSIRGMHSDLHALWIDPVNSNFMVNGNDGGLVVTYDKGKTWKSFTSGPGQLPLCQFFNVSYDMATPFRVYGSMQDHGSYRGAVTFTRPENGTATFRPVDFEGTIGGEGSTHAVNTVDNGTVYASSFYGNLDRADLSKVPPPTATGRGSRFTSVNVAPKPEKGELALRGQWMAPTILSPHNQDIVYHGMQYVFRSMYRGDKWERISPDLTYNDKNTLGDIPYHTLYALSESPKKFGLIYAGTDDGRAHVTKDGGKTWTEISKGLVPNKWVSRIVASQYEEGTVYLTQNGKRDDDFAPYVWKSTDYGATWTSIVGNISLGPVNVIREDPTNAKILYAGTDAGVYVTHDGGASWVVLGAGLPTVYVHDLIVHPRDKVIVIATHGRGMWAIDAMPVEAYKKGATN